MKPRAPSQASTGRLSSSRANCAMFDGRITTVRGALHWENLIGKVARMMRPLSGKSLPRAFSRANTSSDFRVTTSQGLPG